jgi:hypothetical protein
VTAAKLSSVITLLVGFAVTSRTDSCWSAVVYLHGSRSSPDRLICLEASKEQADNLADFAQQSCRRTVID